MKLNGGAMMKKVIAIGFIMLLALLIVFFFIVNSGNKNSECKGFFVVKCDYTVKFYSNENALDLLREHNGELLSQEKENIYIVSLTKRSASRLSKHLNVENIWKRELIKDDALQDSWNN